MRGGERSEGRGGSSYRLEQMACITHTHTHSPHLLPTHSPPTPHLQNWLVMPTEPTQVCQWHGLYILRGGLGELLELETGTPHSQ